MEVGEIRMKLKFYVEDPSLLKKFVYWLWGKGLYLFPLLLGLIDELLIVVGYVLLVVLMIVARVKESVGNRLKRIGEWLGSPLERLEESEEVSKRLREALKNRGLCEVEKEEDRKSVV